MSDYNAIQGNLLDQVRHCQHALKKRKNDIPIIGQLADTYMQLNYYDKAVKAYKKILTLQPKNTQAFNGVATAYVLMGRLDDAERNALRALKSSPTNIRSLEILASIYERQRKLREVIDLLQPHLQRGCHDAALVLPYAKAIAKRGGNMSAIKLLKETLENSELSVEHSISIYFLLGKLYDNQGLYDEAFSCFKKANDLRYVKFDISQPAKECAAIRSVFNKDLMEKKKGFGISDSRPVFIVGMPRSGTTLIDRIISSHSSAVSAGEMRKLPELIESISMRCGGRGGHYSGYVATLDKKQCVRLASEYLDALCKAVSEDAARVTDKMPVNFMYLGMIEILFPNAKIINCTREPLDVCLSCYMQDFHGSKPFLNDLEEIGTIYNNYSILMNHWKNVLNVNIMDVSYECLVSNPDKIIKEIISFIELPWEDGCLRYYENGNFINTVSYDQVDRPIYTSSIGRWSKYERYLDGLRRVISA